MSNIAAIEMTREEAETTNNLIKHYVKHARSLFLEMRDRKGWKALGYSSFEEYGQKEHGYGQAYIYRLAAAAEIQTQIENSPIGEKMPDIPESQLRPLSRVDPESRAEVWQSAQEKAQSENGGKTTAQIVEKAVAEWKAKAEVERNARLNAESAVSGKQKIIDLLTAKLDEKPKAEVIEKTVEVVPADYDEAKRKAAKVEELRDDLAAANDAISELRAKQARAIEEGTREGLRARQSEIDQMEKRRADLESMIASRLDEIARYDADKAATQQAIDAVSAFAVAVGGFAAALGWIEIPNAPRKLLDQLDRAEYLLSQAQGAIDMLRKLPAQADKREAA